MEGFIFNDSLVFLVKNLLSCLNIFCLLPSTLIDTMKCSVLCTRKKKSSMAFSDS